MGIILGLGGYYTKTGESEDNKGQLNGNPVC